MGGGADGAPALGHALADRNGRVIAIQSAAEGPVVALADLSLLLAKETA